MDAIEAVLREDCGRIFAMLARRFGDFHLAEDALAEALAAAAEAWPRTGVPDSPAAWIATVARNAGLSALRHDAVVRDKQAQVATALAPTEPADGDAVDSRLQLIFTCCHPALAEEARVALTLHTVCGLSTRAIARLFFVTEPTIAQRLVRAKRKIKTSRIPYMLPSAETIEDRFETVLEVVYLVFTAGHARREDTPAPLQLCDEAIRLSRLLCQLSPGHVEAHGLLALMMLHHARRDARERDASLITLEDQDRALWHHDEIDEGRRLLDEALARGTPGVYQIQAAIAVLHATATTAADTDWPQIAALYRELWQRQRSPTVAIALAIAEGIAESPERGLARLADLTAMGIDVHRDRVTAARADLLRRAARFEEAAIAYDQAAALAGPREQPFFTRRAAECRAQL